MGLLSNLFSIFSGKPSVDDHLTQTSMISWFNRYKDKSFTSQSSMATALFIQGVALLEDKEPEYATLLMRFFKGRDFSSKSLMDNLLGPYILSMIDGSINWNSDWDEETREQFKYTEARIVMAGALCEILDFNKTFFFKLNKETLPFAFDVLVNFNKAINQ